MINIMNMINVDVNIMVTATGSGSGNGGNNNNNNNNNNNGGSGSGSGSGSGGGNNNNNNNNNNNGGSGSGSGSGAGNNNNNNNNNGRGFTISQDMIPTFLVNSRRRSSREVNENKLLPYSKRITPATHVAINSILHQLILEDSSTIGSKPNTTFSKYLINQVEESFTEFKEKCVKGVPFCELLQIAEF